MTPLERIGIYLFGNYCFHDCELKDWYSDGHDLVTEVEKRIMAEAESETQKEIRGCECDDVRTENEGLLVQQCFIFRPLSQAPTYQHNSIT